jgi:tRNA-Thr(GGU) m(6)t(6)A37 methyltransferase TsaA
VTRSGRVAARPVDDRDEGRRVTEPECQLRPIGRVESPLVDPRAAPKQGDEGGPNAWLVCRPEVADGLRDLRVGTDILVLTWLDRARRDVLAVHPRDDPHAPERGVFSTRSADRPNPIGLHQVRILHVEGTRILVSDLEAVHGTPVLDIKPVLESRDRRSA